MSFEATGTMKNFILIDAEPINEKEFKSNISVVGNREILAKVFAGHLRNSQQLQDIVFDALLNLIAGVSIDAVKLENGDIKIIKAD